MRYALDLAPTLFTAASLALSTSACEGPRSERWAFLDEPTRASTSLRARPPESMLARSPEDEGAPANVDCKQPGAARLPDGSCSLLRTRDVRETQQVLLPSGRFIVGDIPTSYGISLDEPPAVRWSNNPPRIAEIAPFWIDVAEVTVGAYKECVDKGDCTPASCPEGQRVDVNPMLGARAEQLPQTCVTQAQATRYCSSQVPGGRLPTEFELEYAARGPDARIYPWGNEDKDELDARLVEIRSTKLDRSYFGVFGLASNAAEWSSTPWRDEIGLEPFLAGPYRAPDGPVATARAAFEARIAAGAEGGGARRIAELDEPAVSETSAPSIVRWVVRHSPSGRRYAARDGSPVLGIERDLDSLYFSHGPKLGFRCAADPRDEDPSYALAVEPPAVPLLRAAGTIEIFGGVAEAVSKQEASDFCEQLRLTTSAGVMEDFRLPTRAEVELIRESFRGPGPFWTTDGAARQRGGADGEWVPYEATDDAALLARCIRGG